MKQKLIVGVKQFELYNLPNGNIVAKLIVPETPMFTANKPLEIKSEWRKQRNICIEFQISTEILIQERYEIYLEYVYASNNKQIERLIMWYT